MPGKSGSPASVVVAQLTLASQYLRLTVPAGQMPAAAGAKMKRRRATRRLHHYSKAGSGMCTLPVGLSVVCLGAMAENSIFRSIATMRQPQRLLPGWSVRAWPTVPAIRKLVAALEVQTRALPRRPLTATSCTGQIATQRAKGVCPPLDTNACRAAFKYPSVDLNCAFTVLL